MARDCFLYIDYEVVEAAGGLKHTANSSYEVGRAVFVSSECAELIYLPQDAERDVRSHLHLDSSYIVRFNQLDTRCNKAYTVLPSSWQ